VDITTTGATLVANALKVLDDGTMLKSEANLVASLAADWSEINLQSARTILARIAAEEEARTHRVVRASFARMPKSIAQRSVERFGVAVLGDQGEEIGFHTKKGLIFDLSEWLVAEGALRVSVSEADYVFTATNILIERLEARLGLI
jgi:ATP phosphoribosyltransferase